MKRTFEGKMSDSVGPTILLGGHFVVPWLYDECKRLVGRYVRISIEVGPVEMPYVRGLLFTERKQAEQDYEDWRRGQRYPIANCAMNFLVWLQTDGSQWLNKMLHNQDKLSLRDRVAKIFDDNRWTGHNECYNRIVCLKKCVLEELDKEEQAK